MNYSLRGVDVEPRTSELRKRRLQRSRPGLAETSGWTEDRVLARSHRSGPIELLAARYPAIGRLVGELSFRVAARFYLLWKIIPRHSRFKRASAGGGTLP